MKGIGILIQWIKTSALMCMSVFVNTGNLDQAWHFWLFLLFHDEREISIKIKHHAMKGRYVNNSSGMDCPLEMG
jgi:hypothetical protein